MADKAFITPKVLKWARHTARMSLETAAAKVAVAPERLTEWEEGTSQPTIKQAETLANSYRRPFALLFLPEVPKDFMPLQDFRKKNSKPLGTASTFIIREIQQKQSWISELNRDNNEQKLAFVGKYNLQSNPQSVSEDILNTLQIDPFNYTKDKPILEWTNRAEKKGIFISRTSFIHSHLKLNSEELQGFTIADEYAPFVFINSEDWDTSQLFTLVHELAHIWIAESGISNDVELEIKHKDIFHPVELFCNEVAANALMPVKLMHSLSLTNFNSGKDVFKISKKIGISSFALLVRALHLNVISTKIYRKLKDESEIEYQAFLKYEEEKNSKQKEERTGGPNTYLLRLNKNSRLFTEIVLDTFKSGFIEPTYASALLNTKVNNFPKLEAILYK